MREGSRDEKDVEKEQEWKGKERKREGENKGMRKGWKGERGIGKEEGV